MLVRLSISSYLLGYHPFHVQSCLRCGDENTETSREWRTISTKKKRNTLPMETNADGKALRLYAKIFYKPKLWYHVRKQNLSKTWVIGNGPCISKMSIISKPQPTTMLITIIVLSMKGWSEVSWWGSWPNWRRGNKCGRTSFSLNEEKGLS